MLTLADVGDITGRATVPESTIGGECGIYYSVFSGNGDLPVGFSLEQRFTWYITSFYGFEPDEDWWFVHDGNHPLPT